MPLIGLGAQYGFSDDGFDRGQNELGPQYLSRALQTGFRLVDTARCYGTEVHVLPGIGLSGLERADVFVVSKAWPGLDHNPGLESSRAAIAESVSRLGGYVDLYLVHHPVTGWQELWRALEEAKDAGLVRSIGVSNFRPEHLEELRTFARHPVVVNQIHLHPLVYADQHDTVQYCKQHGITIMAYPRSPWGLGKGSAIDTIAERLGRTRAQVMLRWGVDHGFVVIPLSTNEQHLRENLAVREFRLTREQIEELDLVQRNMKINFAIDTLNADFVGGWAFAAQGLKRIQVLVDGTSVGDATRGRPRPDVHRAFPAPNALDSGFGFIFPEGSLKNGLCSVQLSFELTNGTRTTTDATLVPNPKVRRSATDAHPRVPARAPFPLEVLQLLRDLRGSEFPSQDDWSDEQVQRAVDDLVLLAQRGSKRNEGLFRYLSFLESVRTHAEFVVRHFPKFNARVPLGDKDEITVASTPQEILCMANHLYVLKSRGTEGRFLEFGCFKGFSTSCLSFACHQLGIGFDVFDSFEGLPASENAYYNKGEFAGSLDEVSRNVRELGRIDCVEFHKGFFSDTLPGATVNPICIWMDVDLYSSSRDVMTILPALPRTSCVFSHESEPTDFNGDVVRVVAPDSPLVPIVEAFQSLERPIRGRYLFGQTGAIWEHGVAIPVLPWEQLRRLLEVC